MIFNVCINTVCCYMDRAVGGIMEYGVQSRTEHDGLVWFYRSVFGLFVLGISDNCRAALNGRPLSFSTRSSSSLVWTLSNNIKHFDEL